jgi:hypothetical protein
VGSKTNQNKVKEIVKELVIKELGMRRTMSVPLRVGRKNPVSSVTYDDKVEDRKLKIEGQTQMQEGVCVK